MHFNHLWLILSKTKQPIRNFINKLIKNFDPFKYFFQRRHLSFSRYSHKTLANTLNSFNKSNTIFLPSGVFNLQTKLLYIIPSFLAPAHFFFLEETDKNNIIRIIPRVLLWIYYVTNRKQKNIMMINLFCFLFPLKIT